MVNTKMAKINRVGSPMDLCDENYDQTKQEIERQKELLERKQRTRSPFFIGSIQQVNKKISKLDHKLQQYTQLVVESRASDVVDQDLLSEDSARGKDRHEKRERETKDMNKFAGYFSMKQTFLPGRSERVKNISKVSMQPSKATVVKKETGKPKFVELHQYPGYDHTELTLLPDDIPAVKMLQKAADAHVHLERKMGKRKRQRATCNTESKDNPVKCLKRGDFVLFNKIWPVRIEKTNSAENSFTVYSKSDDSLYYTKKVESMTTNWKAIAQSDSVFRAYDSLKTICSEVSLSAPERITSISMRKYIATLSQVIDMKEHELEWLCGHLGHTADIHKLHYRATSGFIERVNIGKLMLLQDLNLAGQFAGQRLQDIDIAEKSMGGQGGVLYIQVSSIAGLKCHCNPGFKTYFELWFYSNLSQAVFLDLFWYLFLDKYQSSKNSQVKLFNRAAHNYVKLLMYVKNPQYRDIFFKDYPSLIAQAMYAAYCYSFPDSYKQFGEPFKEDLVALVYCWLTGIKPAPRIWMHWDMEKLEPPNIKLREEMAQAQKNKKTSAALNMDFLDHLVPLSKTASQYTSTTSLNQSVSKSSLLSVGGRNRKRTQIVKKGSKHRPNSPESSQDGAIIEAVAESQPGFKGAGKKPADSRKVIDALTPIRETTAEDMEDATEVKVSNPSIVAGKPGIPKGLGEKRHIESHPACRGPDFTKCVFNMQGQSPLVAHCFRMKNAAQGGGQVVWVQRTQLENLPMLDSQTYRDIIKESFRRVREIEKGYNEFHDKNIKESLAAFKRNRKMVRDHEKLKSALLAKPKEVKRLCELLILEQNKDQDSVSAGADAALESALLSCQQ